MIIYNPLPIALAHYAAELESVVRRADDSLSVTIVTTNSEGLTGASRWVALAQHIWRTRRVLRHKGPVIVVWPLLGWYELLLLKSRRSDVYVVVHDPKPLRPQTGLSEKAAKRTQRWTRHQPGIICHSSVAVGDTREAIPTAAITTVPHPLLQDTPADRAERPADGPLRLLVAGQYKPARDLELLGRLGERLPELNATGEIRGSNWPDVPGWTVESRFLEEHELTSSITSADVIVIPYEHYYQSGIAVRAVENGVAVAGRRHPFLEELLGADYPGLVEGSTTDDWVQALERLRASPARSLDRRKPVVDAWVPLLTRDALAIAPRE